MSHPYVSVVAGMERPRAGFGPEHCTAGGYCPINKIFGAILTRGLHRGKVILVGYRDSPLGAVSPREAGEVAEQVQG